MEELRIDLGGGLSPRPGHINIDLIGEADIQWDLEKGLPDNILPNSVAAFTASQLIEHLADVIPLMNDCYEALVLGGLFEISTPYAGTKQWYQDPTHKRAYVEESFLYFAMDSPFRKEQDQYGITARFEIVRAERGMGVDDWQLFVTLRKGGKQN